MNQTFTISKLSDIFVYGGGALGRSFYSQLKNDGYHVNGIIDKNADKLTNKEGVAFYTIWEFAGKFKDGDVVVICVHNALWHAEIVESLIPLGVENVLFVPLGRDFGRRKSDEMMKAYNHFINREYNALYNIPTLSSLCDKSLNVKKAVLHETDDSVVCWIDITALYTSESVAFATKRHAPEELEKFANTPMPGMLPYVNLFRLLAGQNEGEGDSFVRLCKRFQNSIDEYSDKEFLNDRFDLYNELNTQLNFGIKRFIDSAPDCMWNDKGFFNLLDGMSRTTFLYSKGFQFVPVKMKKEEFEYWANQKELELVEYSIPQLTDWEIEHPAFIEYPVKHPGVKRQAMTAIEEFFNSKKWDGVSVVDYTETSGCLSRYFARQGAEVVRCVDREGLSFEIALNKLFRQENVISIRERAEEIEKAGIIAMTVNINNIDEAFSHIYNNVDAAALCLYHNMNEEEIVSFENIMNRKPQWVYVIKGRESVTISIYQ